MSILDGVLYCDGALGVPSVGGGRTGSGKAIVGMTRTLSTHDFSFKASVSFQLGRSIGKGSLGF